MTTATRQELIERYGKCYTTSAYKQLVLTRLSKAEVRAYGSLSSKATWVAAYVDELAKDDLRKQQEREANATVWDKRKHKNTDSLPALTHTDVDDLCVEAGLSFLVHCRPKYDNSPYNRLHDLGHWMVASEKLRQETLAACRGYEPGLIPNDGTHYRDGRPESLVCCWSMLKLDEIGRRMPITTEEANNNGCQWSDANFLWTEATVKLPVGDWLPMERLPVMSIRKLLCFAKASER